MGIQQRLLSIAVIPLLALAILSFSSIFDAFNQKNVARGISLSVADAIVFSDVVHELQKERGSSAVFIGSKGRSFATELTNQRGASDVKIDQLRQILTRTDNGKDPILGRIQNKLGNLSSTRNSVKNLELKVPQMAKFYTGLINELITATSHKIEGSSDPRLASYAQAYLAMMHAKEAAGLERAMGGAGFGAGKFSGPLYTRFVSLGAEQDIYLREAMHFAVEEDKKDIEGLKGTSEDNTVNQYRMLANDMVFDQVAPTISGSEWFQAATRRIEPLKTVEDQIALTVVTRANDFAARKNAEFMSLVSLSLISMIAGIGVSILQYRNIVGTVKSLSQSMKTIGGGNYGAKISGLKRRDQLGDMARTTEKMREGLAEAAKIAEAALFKSAGVEAAATGLLTVGPDLKITYANPALIETLTRNLEVFRELNANFDPHKIVGANFSLFFANEHSHLNLNDPTSYPISVELSVGDRKFGLSASAILNDDNKFAGLVASIADTTTERVNAGILSALDGAQLVAEFNVDGTITKINDICADTLEFSKRDVVGQPHKTLLADDTPNQAEYGELWSKLKRGEHIGAKHKYRSKNGALVWVRATYSPILDAKGKPFKVVLFGADITETETIRQQTSEERKRRLKEQEAVVAELGSALKKLSGGKLTANIDTKFPEEYDQLRVDFNGAVATLHQTLVQIISNGNDISMGANEIDEATKDLADRTENQAATLEQTSATLDQIAATVTQTAQSAEEVNKVVVKARQEAEESSDIVRSAVGAMSRIESSSNQISQIIGVIDEIAFQTNLLALNAGVEAARAGDAGRGFAVVAQEVRELAQRSSGAAKEIKDLINASETHVSDGVSHVGSAGEALQKIVDGIVNMSQLVDGIASSAGEQATAVGEINAAVNQMDQVTNQNASMVESTANAARNLTIQTNELRAMVNQFETKEGAATKSQASHSRAQSSSVTAQQQRVQEFAAQSGAGPDERNTAPAPASIDNAALDADSWDEF